MTTISEIKRELQTYIAQAVEIENANKSLKERVSLLETELKSSQEKVAEERKAYIEKMKIAKDSWKEQAIEYGRKQREQAFEECDNTVRSFKELFLSESSNKTNSLVSSLVRSKFNEAQNSYQSKIFGAIAHSSTAESNLIICDFDIHDCHVAIRNRSHSDISISHYIVRFQHSGHIYKFPEGVVIHPASNISLWWGPRNQFRSASQRGSFVWPIDVNTHVTADIHEISELIDRHGRVVFSVSTNQDTELMMNGTIPHVSASEKKNKRKRDELATVLTSPTPKKAHLNRGHPNSHSHSYVNNNTSSSSSSNSSSLSNHSSSSHHSNHNHNYDSNSSINAIEVINLEDKGVFNGVDDYIPKNDLIANMNWESIFLMPTPKPSLFHRNAGPITILSVDMTAKKDIPLSSPSFSSNGELTTWNPARALQNSRYEFKDVHISIYNDSRETLPLTGWRLLIIGYPTSTYEIPAGTVLPAKRSILFTSNEMEAEGQDENNTDAEEEDMSDDISVGGTRRRRHRESTGRPSMTTRNISKTIQVNNSLVTRSGGLYVHANSTDNLSMSGSQYGDHESSNGLSYPHVSPSTPSHIIVIHDLSNIAKYFPFPRSVHLLDATGQHVCEFVESGDLSGVFGSSFLNPFGTKSSSSSNGGSSGNGVANGSRNHFESSSHSEESSSSNRASCCIQ